MYKILKNIIEMDDYSVQKLSSSSEPFEWNTVEGTELNVDDCIDRKGKIAVKGNTEQEQLSGKNLLDIYSINPAGYSITKSGITFSMNEDGSVSMQGTATANAFLELYISSCMFEPFIQIQIPKMVF
mgnify:CR=1 FL=1